MIPIQWGKFGLDAVAAQNRIRELWEAGWNTKSISNFTGVPEARVDRVVTDHITRKRIIAGKPP